MGVVFRYGGGDESCEGQGEERREGHSEASKSWGRGRGKVEEQKRRSNENTIPRWVCEV